MYHISTPSDYSKQVEAVQTNSDSFWDELAKHFVWERPYDRIQECDMEHAVFNWFLGGKTNICYNALDRHVASQANKVALIFEPNNPEESARSYTYEELHREVCKLANVLKDQGVKEGDRVCIYLPMIPELAISVLACARIGAIHSVVFGGFSAGALATRINDCSCSMILTSDGGYRGNKTIPLKEIVDEALKTCPTVLKTLIFQRTNEPIQLQTNRDVLVNDLLIDASTECAVNWMDSEAPLFILYTSGSTGKPKGMVHATGGYMVYTAYTFQNVFQLNKTDVFWCTADIGWITGHSYLLYGALLNGATTLLFEGIPTYPDASRFWQVIDTHCVTHFYTAPTAIRSLAKESIKHVETSQLDSLKVLGSVGEPINEEAWNWYNEHIGKSRCPIVDTWWQTETGGILISALANITPTIPTFATWPIPGINPVLLNSEGQEILENDTDGNLCIKTPWPSIARTIWGDHQRYLDTYFKAYPGYYFTGDGAYRDKNGNYRITGRVDDVVIVSGHNLGTAPIEDAINEHPAVAESAIVGFPHDIKGNALYGFVILKDDYLEENTMIASEINGLITQHIGAIAKLDRIQFVSGLPKTRSGKIMRRILRKIAAGDLSDFGDTSTLLNPDVIAEICSGRAYQ